MATLELPLSTETGTLGIMHLKRYWRKCIAQRNGNIDPSLSQSEWSLDMALLSALGLGLQPTLDKLFGQVPSFETFEAWVLEVNGRQLQTDTVSRFNQLVESGKVSPAPDTDISANPFSETDMQFWEENGYVILRNAAEPADCREAVILICEYIGVDEHDPSTWYRQHPDRLGIMIQLFKHPVLNRIRASARIREAFMQLWGRRDIWLSTDRVGFNPPETESWKYPGDKLHWDVSLELPIPFCTQGILYLTDTAENQGAFSLVPGFQHRIGNWLNSLPPEANPRQEDLYALGVKPIAANAGDLIIWHHALPHASSPNTASVPRYVQYINYRPADLEVKKWR
ncbi:phytanoyl-CoA dioxygenase family protein [Sediminibacterium ginsengisoli]|uniref:Ectoine hydroxylase-related dioxygenase, phytanoyl-CoA dioxygenase (PhyH) family n=1 Tax=Sediminibacterium ginsengisoli TaxID=413434 RepID=A0A1T4PNM2_9BACT|nr:phytanoyl-CoA dioxygenase family protein [Sediminibacterium ginsengisoli]SJZ93132.1 Ectoine hydroxylase-related dioxygenase, phytanoyl-CoA dioxygenase (PhyH) family [Sediminibacterium ginsengisoli]